MGFGGRGWGGWLGPLGLFLLGLLDPKDGGVTSLRNCNAKDIF